MAHKTKKPDNMDTASVSKVSSNYPEKSEVENPSVDQSNADADQVRHNLNAKLANPLAGLSHDELMQRGEEYCRSHEMTEEDDIRAFRLGAIVAQDPARFTEVKGLSAEEVDVFSREVTKKWSQPWKLFLIIILCSVCAAVQGMGKYYEPRERK